ncbi:SDR family oxidoreductase [Zoogloea dura]|uniref:SDR family oxidoreductase n=1 Tax=Zoogloea dura TaxID=2728840 RepID=A0A848G9D9_9RHOO|nr:SDR family oxidoreductase [Zoogloea dura]NML27466.1 SDR family oxidoreductase [Zoogloea dura]
MFHKILVLGATGNVGQPLVQALLSKGEQVKAASRTGKPIAGAEGVIFDYARPDTFSAAFEGVDRAYVMLPTGYVNQKELLLPVIQAAAQRHVKVVFQSAFGAEVDDSTPYRQVEIALQNSGTPYVILRPNWFSDNFHTFWRAGIKHGQITLPAADGKSSFIDVRDIADCAAAALTTERFDGEAFNLTGPEAISYGQAAQLLSEAIDKPVVYTPIDDKAFIGMLISSGVSNDYARFMAAIFYTVREGWAEAVTDHVQILTGKAPRSLGTYARDHSHALC